MDGPADTPPPDFVQAAERYWHEKGSNVTVVRRVLCEVIAGHDEAFDAEMLLAWAKKRDPLISLSSCYRTLNALGEAGLLVEIEGRDGRRMHQKAPSNLAATSHIVCRNCGIVIPVDDPCLPLRETNQVLARGFRPEKLALRVEASCEDWERTGACEKCEGRQVQPGAPSREAS